MANREKKQRKSHHDPCIINLKNSKQLNKYIEEAMESDSYNSSSEKENTMYEKFVPD